MNYRALDLNALTDKQLAVIWCNMDMQRGTDKQIAKILKYWDREILLQALNNRIAREY